MYRPIFAVLLSALLPLDESFTPTIEALYDDPEVQDAKPFYAIVDMRALLEDAVRRPAAQTGDAYFDVSQAFYRAVHDVLADLAAADAALEVLALDLDAMLTP